MPRTAAVEHYLSRPGRAMRPALVLVLPALAAALVLAPLAAGAAEDALHLDTPTDPVPAFDFTAERLSGGKVTLAGLEGRVVLINFWATWCVPCLLEMPAMQRLAERMADRPFTLLAVNVQEPREKVAAFVKKHGFTFPVLLDPDGDISNAYAVRNLPLTYVVDKQGRVVRRAIGAREWDQPAAVALFEKLTAAPAGGGSGLRTSPAR